MIELGSALAASAGGSRVGIIRGLAPAWSGAIVAGPALTVRGAPNDNLALHRAAAEVTDGEVIVLDAGGSSGAAICGDLLALAAHTRGAAGLVVDGAIRDRVALAELGFPVFARGASPVTPRKEEPGELRVPIHIDDVRIETGDLVVADADGVVVVPAAHAAEIVAGAEALAAEEERLRGRIAAGETTIDLLGLSGRLPA